MDHFLEQETSIDEIKEKNRIDPLQLKCDRVKNALTAEAKKWKQSTVKISPWDFSNKTKTQLSDKISGLEDLQKAMESM
jgi:hypothetical protein